MKTIQTKLIFTFTLLAMLASTTFAMQPPQQQFDAISQVGDLPFQMIEKNGKTFLMSSNGRYVIKGQLQDMWDGGKVLTSVAQLKKSVSSVNFDALGLDVDELWHLSYGSGPEKVMIFVAPGCGYCKKTLKQMAGLETQYTFNIIPLPIMGPRSEDAVRRLASVATKRPNAAFAALLNDDYADLTIDPNLNVESIGRSMITAQVLGINSVPVIIDQHHRMSKGAPQDLATHLKR